jgi:hypothetical protein
MRVVSQTFTAGVPGLLQQIIVASGAELGLVAYDHGIVLWTPMTHLKQAPKRSLYERLRADNAKEWCALANRPAEEVFPILARLSAGTRDEHGIHTETKLAASSDVLGLWASKEAWRYVGLGMALPLERASDLVMALATKIAAHDTGKPTRRYHVLSDLLGGMLLDWIARNASTELMTRIAARASALPPDALECAETAIHASAHATRPFIPGRKFWLPDDGQPVYGASIKRALGIADDYPLATSTGI